MQKNTKMIVIGITILFSLMGIVIGNHTSFEDDLNDLKPVARENNVNLFVLAKTAKHSFTAITSQLNNKAVLGFQLSTNSPIYISLFVSENDKPPSILLKSARIPPGRNKQVDKDGIRFLFHVSKTQILLKFCIIHADNAKSLRKQLLNINHEWNEIPDYQCKSVNV